MAGEEKDKSKIDELRRRLYSRSGSVSSRERRALPEEPSEIAQAWAHEAPTLTEDDMAKKGRQKKLLGRLLLLSVAFFVVALGLAAYFFFASSSAVSARNVDIRVEGPTSIDGGETLSLQITVVNRNDVAMQLADLIIEYPDGTRSASDLNIELPRHRESLGDIGAGEQVRRTVQAILFGEENAELPIGITVEYRVEGSNAIFFKESEYQALIASSPLSLSVAALEETTSGQDLELAVTLRSNSKTVMENVLLRAEYPFGFSFDEATPEPAFASNVWTLGDIPPSGERTIRIRGTLSGQDNEERVFRFSSGIQSEEDEKELAAAFITATHPVVIKRPFLAADIAIAGESGGTYVARSGEAVRVDVTLTNTLPTRIFDAEAAIALRGSAVDRSSISVSGGFYRSVDDTIVWNRSTTGSLDELPAGGRTTLSFTFKPLPASLMANVRQPEIVLDGSVSARRISETQAPELIESSISRTIQVATDLRLVSRSLYWSGPFQNTGPIPPEAERETTYTIEWSVTNGSNDVDNARVVATLPPYVRWLGTISPASESVSYNPVGGRVTWQLGPVSAGVGHGSAPARVVSFQVGLVPSTSQIGQSPTLVGEQTISGRDRFTSIDVRAARSELSTQLVSDPQFEIGDGIVVE